MDQLGCSLNGGINAHGSDAIVAFFCVEHLLGLLTWLSTKLRHHESNAVQRRKTWNEAAKSRISLFEAYNRFDSASDEVPSRLWI